MYVVLDAIMPHARNTRSGVKQGVYVLCRFWESRGSFERGDDYLHRNDFIMENLNATETFRRVRMFGQRVKTLSGDLLTKEEFLALAPNFPQVEIETYTVDLEDQILDRIEAYWDRFEARGRTDQKNNAHPAKWNQRPDEEDPKGFLKANVKAMRGQGRKRRKR